MWLTHAHKRWLMARHCTDILVTCSSIVCFFSHFFHIKSLFIFSKITEINFSRAQTDLYISFTGYCKYNNLNYGNAYWHNVWQYWQKILGCLGLLHTSNTGKGMNLLLPSLWPFILPILFWISRRLMMKRLNEWLSEYATYLLLFKDASFSSSILLVLLNFVMSQHQVISYQKCGWPRMAP